MGLSAAKRHKCLGTYQCFRVSGAGEGEKRERPWQHATWWQHCTFIMVLPRRQSPAIATAVATAAAGAAVAGGGGDDVSSAAIAQRRA